MYDLFDEVCGVVELVVFRKCDNSSIFAVINVKDDVRLSWFELFYENIFYFVLGVGHRKCFYRACLYSFLFKGLRWFYCFLVTFPVHKVYKYLNC